MTRRSKIWQIGVALFVVINAGGAVFAAVQGEMMHAMTHVVVFFAGLAGAAIWLMRQSDQRVVPGAQAASASLDHLQQAVDTIALEVERIGEAQRFEAQLLKDRLEKPLPKKDQ